MSEANIAQTHGAVVASYGFTQIVDIEANKALVCLLTYPREDKMREGKHRLFLDLYVCCGYLLHLCIYCGTINLPLDIIRVEIATSWLEKHNSVNLKQLIPTPVPI